MNLDQLIERQQDAIRTAEQHVNESPTDIERANEVRRLYELSHSTGSLGYQRQHMAELVERREHRDAVVADHAAAEQLNATNLAAMRKELVARRGELVDAVEGAIGALTALWDTAAAYDKQLAEQAAALVAADLPARYVDQDEVVRFDDGGYPPGEHQSPWLVLAGEPWHRILPRGVIDYAAHAATAGRTYSLTSEPRWRASTLYQTLDPVVRRPDPVPMQPSSAASMVQMDYGAPSATKDGGLRYQDGRVIPPREKYRDNDGVWRWSDDDSQVTLR